MKKLITWTSLILAVSLFAEPGDDKGQLKRSMKVVPLSSIYLSTENGGTNYASVALSDGVGIYTTQEDEYSKAISYLNGKYGDDAKKAGETSLKEYVLDNGTIADKELANKLNPNTTQKSNPGDSCDDKNPQTENDMYIDYAFTCVGKKIHNSVKCEGEPIGKEFVFEGKTYLVVNDDTIWPHLHEPDTLLCTTHLTNMSWMFVEIDVSQDISNWDTSNVTDMNTMFRGRYDFNQDISGWDTSNVENMAGMFEGAASFNQDIGGWDTSNVTFMPAMFYGATSFNQNISGWDVSKVTDMSYMFGYATSFNQNISRWDVSKVTDYTNFATGSAITNAPSFSNE